VVGGREDVERSSEAPMNAGVAVLFGDGEAPAWVLRTGPARIVD